MLLNAAIFSFMRYCTFRKCTPVFKRAALSINEIASPFCAASFEKIVGGSCKWSPAKTNLFPFAIGIQQAGSNACPASSITTTSNTRSRSMSFADPTSVVQITSACSMSLSNKNNSVSRASRIISFASLKINLRCSASSRPNERLYLLPNERNSFALLFHSRTRE